jgi:hypothetical protein
VARSAKRPGRNGARSLSGTWSVTSLATSRPSTGARVTPPWLTARYSESSHGRGRRSAAGRRHGPVGQPPAVHRHPGEDGEEPGRLRQQGAGVVPPRVGGDRLLGALADQHRPVGPLAQVHQRPGLAGQVDHPAGERRQRRVWTSLPGLDTARFPAPAVPPGRPGGRRSSSRGSRRLPTTTTTTTTTTTGASLFRSTTGLPVAPGGLATARSTSSRVRTHRSHQRPDPGLQGRRAAQLPRGGGPGRDRPFGLCPGTWEDPEMGGPEQERSWPMPPRRPTVP